MIMELKELNCLCKCIKNVRSSQRCISMNFFNKAQYEHRSSMCVSLNVTMSARTMNKKLDELKTCLEERLSTQETNL